MKNKWLKLIVCIAIPLGAGFLSGLLIRNDTGIYETLNLPAFAPDPVVFRIVWPILYVLMGIGLYLVIITGKDNLHVILLFALQLALNVVWPIVFFRFELFFLAFVLLLCLLFTVSLMIIEFCKLNKTAALIQLPYLVWLIFAAALNYFVYLLN